MMAAAAMAVSDCIQNAGPMMAISTPMNANTMTPVSCAMLRA
jgi:hypothetical protein